MRVVVTGALGFIGGAVVRQLLGAAGIELIQVSRRAASGCVLVSDYAETPSGDVLIHLAESADRSRASTDDRSASTIGGLISRGYSRIVYASSAAVYGDRIQTPRRPDEPVQPVDAYAQRKRRGELAVLATGHAVVARLSNVYGRGMSGRNVVSTILRQIPGSGPLTVADRRPVRDFVWVDDAAAVLAATALGGPTGVFNVGSGSSMSIGELARLALTIAGEENRAVAGAAEQGDRSTLGLDISATIEAWGWRPVVPLREGLASLMAERPLHST